MSKLQALLRCEFTDAVRSPVAPERVKVSMNALTLCSEAYALTLRSDVVANHRRDSNGCIPEKLLLVFVLLESASIVIPDRGHVCQFACRRCGTLLEQSTTAARSRWPRKPLRHGFQQRRPRFRQQHP